MITQLMVAALTLAAPARTDTIVPVDQDTRLEVENFRGEVVVRAWGRDQVSVEADLDRDEGLDVVRTGTVLRVRPRRSGGFEERDARGRVEAVSVNEEVTLSDVEGEIYVETTNGDISIENVRSGSTRATTVNGDIDYAGSIEGDGHYVFATHNGDLSVTVPENANATVSVSTYHGEFESDFPVRLTGTTRDRQFNFTLGSGSARVELESFNGEIMLRRP
ncbi:MAG: DUF4097 family beta strand repeat-containing protein [Gemmatimonadota bacterium]